VHIVDMTAAGVKVAPVTATATAFWLPSSVHVDWRQTPHMGERVGPFAAAIMIVASTHKPCVFVRCLGGADASRASNDSSVQKRA
jgi:hypothetical protein